MTVSKVHLLPIMLVISFFFHSLPFFASAWGVRKKYSGEYRTWFDVLLSLK